jgi:crotonobetainyl-CoA:carnitine CoA-transferase CaiB-like acyl-CoA transferase
MTEQSRPLAGMRVIELAHIMAGPLCGMLLADMGADVIKVEKIDGGDDSRRMVPPQIGDQSAAFLMMNRNKRGLALDLKADQGREVLKRLLAEADCVIENFRHDTMARLGLSYDELKALNPGLIYVEISGYGRTGPYSERAGFDLVAQGASGLMSITGPGKDDGPVKVGAPVTDITAGILAAMGAAAAYAGKLATGQGTRVDTSLFEAGITQTYWQSAIALATGESPQALGSAHPLNAPYQAFPTADGHINVGAANQRNWLRLLEVMGAQALNEDPRFASNADRMANLDALVAELEPRFRAQTSSAWLDQLDAHGVPAGPILSIGEMLNHPQAIARDMVVDMAHPSAGPIRGLGMPVKFHGATPQRYVSAPTLGQHSREILAEAGYGSAEIDALLEARVVFTTTA